MIAFPGDNAPEKEYTGVGALTCDHPASWGQDQQQSLDSYHTELAGESKALNYASSGDKTPWTEYTGIGVVTSVHPACLGPTAWFRELNSYLTRSQRNIVHP